MDILLFGVSNVGKSTVGRILAQKCGYTFYDLDEEIKKEFEMSLQEFVDTIWPLASRDKMRGELIGKILEREGNKVIAVTPIYYSRNFTNHLKKEGVIGIELQDAVENIFNRLVFTDENDQVYKDSVEYREAHRSYYLKEIRKDHTFYKSSFEKIPNKFQMNGEPPEIVANRLIEEYGLK